MNSKLSKSNVIITVLLVIIVLCTVLFTLDTEQVYEKKQEELIRNNTVAEAAARTPSGISGSNERYDICLWAKAQKDYTESSRAPATAFHREMGQMNRIGWCQLFVNWCSVKANIPSSNFVRSSNSPVDCLSKYASLKGVNRKAGKGSTPEAGWLIYESYGAAKPSHVGLYVGGGYYAHGNYNNGHVRVINKCYGTFRSYAKPYYRSKIFYNTNQKGASYNGHTYPNEYSTWYTEEKSFTLPSSGPTCSGKTFQGWYTTDSCTTKKSSITTSDRGPIRVFGKWSGGGTTTTPPPSTTAPPSTTTPPPSTTAPPSTTTSPPTATPEPEVWSPITYTTNGGYWTGYYPTSYKEGVGVWLTENIARTGYTFNGWYDNWNYTGYRYRIYDWETGAKHEYAGWTPNKYDLYLYTERGKVTQGGYSFADLGNYYYRYHKKYTYDTTEYLPTQPYGIDRRGHSFDGWFKNSSYTGSSYTRLVPGTIGTQIFYAKWTPLVYDLILHKNGGTCVNPRIDNGVVVGDDIIGTYTYAQGSTFPEADDDIYKKDRIFAGWYDNARLSGTPQTGIRTGDDDTAPIGDKEYWARWLEISPDAPANDATEVLSKNTGDELVLYIYNTYRIDVDDGGGVARESTSTAINTRYFTFDIKVDTNPGTNSQIKVWLSESEKPDDTSKRLGSDWKLSSSKSKSWSSSTRQYITYDNSKLKFTCPKDVEDFIGGTGSKKIYIHVESVTGNTGTYAINLVNRSLYSQH